LDPRRIAFRQLIPPTITPGTALALRKSPNMTSPSPSDILLDPIPELESALRTNAFGINPSTSRVIHCSSFPITPEDKQRIASDSASSGTTGTEVVAAAEIGLLEGGIAQITLDRRGYTVRPPSRANSSVLELGIWVWAYVDQLENVINTDGKTFPSTTYESLEAMLIAVSPGYVEAIGREVGNRFEGFTRESAVADGGEGQASQEEVRVAEGGVGGGR